MFLRFAEKLLTSNLIFLDELSFTDLEDGFGFVVVFCFISEYTIYDCARFTSDCHWAVLGIVHLFIPLVYLL